MLKQQLQQRLQQRLSPQQIQVIRMLELNTLEMEERVKQELIDNPALEEGREATPEGDTSEYESEERGESNETPEEMSLADYRSEEEIPNYRLETGGYQREEQQQEIPFSSSSTFHESLIAQLGLRELTPLQEQIGEYIIGNLDDNGYLQRPLTAISDDLIFQAAIDVSPQQIEEVLQTIQDFEPAGVGASNLRECLLLQLERKEGTPATLLAYQIVDESFEEFTKKHYEKLQRQYSVTPDELRQAIHEITTLTPKPGSSYNDTYTSNMEQVIPDFLVESHEGELYLSLNNNNLPELRINRTYATMLSDYTGNKKNQTSDNRNALLFIKQKMDAAQSFVDAIKQRQATLLGTMEVIVSLQKEFFLTGDEARLRPMILKDVAEQCGYDISTISRVSNQKYVQTPFGVYSLKHFFSESMQNEQGEEVSSREIKQILKECIAHESKQKPLSDDKLCELLKEKGYLIARRTVAKYREQLAIPVARLRKEI